MPHAIRYFLRQDLPNKELIILDDGEDPVQDLVPQREDIRYYRLERKLTLGAKLNLGCEYARGSLIAHWDDDDWYAPRRLRYQEEELQKGRKSLCGINRLLYYDLRKQEALQYIYPPEQRVWLIGSSLFYRKELWKAHPFADINVGMDGLFVWAAPKECVAVLPDPTISVHMIHDRNVSPKKTEGAWWNPYPVEEIREIMEGDYVFYNKEWGNREAGRKERGSSGNGDERSLSASPEIALPGSGDSPEAPPRKLLKNIFACLVHEKGDCIADLVSNLRYQDPSSLILLYNGGPEPGLLAAFRGNREGVFVHPAPAVMKHGYLHGFALDCMGFALEHFEFDTLTIVDSDQLCLRKGYSEFLTTFFASPAGRAVGMLSSKPARVGPDNKTNLVALQAFKEYELWKPFIQDFPDGEQKFVHWTFWPSTVFTRDAIRDLVRLFRENLLLQEIMGRTKIWATEEVILPTLVRLLGYEIAANPCSYEFVNYKKTYTVQDLSAALKKEEAYWVHPIERSPDHPLRKYVRRQSMDYAGKEQPPGPKQPSLPSATLTASILDRIRKIEGWLSDAEAELLIAIAREACKDKGPSPNLAEVGSYHGRSTVVLGMAVRSVSPGAKIYAVDSHDGQLGAADQGLRSYPPSLEMFRRNIQLAGLGEMVETVTDKSYSTPWQIPVSLLFIDGLHDYFNVARDFRYFSDGVLPQGYVAFHDHADYFPGVKLFVKELLKSGSYQVVRQVESLIVLQKK